MIISRDKTVAEVVTENIKASHIFKKYNIDFCCGGDISIQAACEKKGLDYNHLEKELQNIKKENSNDYTNWSLPFLIDYIINVHHKYITESLPMIHMYGNKVAKVHGHKYPETIEINKLFQDASKDLSAHMMKEELILFPFIKQLVTAENNESKTTRFHISTVKNPIDMMEKEHETVGEIFKKISKLSCNYTPPEGACNTFRALYDKLEEFEQDLHVHIHLENNILHPRALALEHHIKEKK
ncbi:MAG: iron-sulfur cluster repair di-iron protein [Flavobacteriaceae bacterium]|nr:iron-sulfur cluster repair di-iron protein [Flavobacteriaceae bacterium]